MADESVQDQDSFSKSVDHLRATAKWILVSFAAVGTVLAAGSQLSSIGRFNLSDWRLWVAVIAVVLVLGAIGVAIWLVIGVETSGEVSLKSLNTDDKKFLEENPGLLDGYPSINELRDDYYSYIRQRYEASQAGDEDGLASATAWTNYLGALVGQLLSAIRYDRVVRKFDKAVPVLIVASVAAGLAVAAFAWAANPETTNASAPAFRTPTEASAQLTESGSARLADSLGEGCTDVPVSVVVLSETSGVYDVVSVPTAECQVARFPVSDEVGTVLPSQSVAVSSRETS